MSQRKDGPSMSARRWPSICDQTRRSIGAVVEAQGGDRQDTEDLLDTFERLHVVTGPRTDAMRREAANARCHCADGAEADDGRRERYWGRQ